jgi:hypothetical protein
MSQHFEQYTCPACGVGNVSLQPVIGRKFRHHMIPDLELPPGLVLPTCDHCHELWLGDDERLAAFQNALDAAFAKSRDERISASLDRLRRDKVRQWDLEPLLGLSSGYLSKLKKRKKQARASLVSALMLLGIDTSRVEELRRLWTETGWREATDSTPTTDTLASSKWEGQGGSLQCVPIEKGPTEMRRWKRTLRISVDPFSTDVDQAEIT